MSPRVSTSRGRKLSDSLQHQLSNTFSGDSARGFDCCEWVVVTGVGIAQGRQPISIAPSFGSAITSSASVRGANNVLDHPVQDGDYLELNGGGLLYQIVQTGSGATNNVLKLSRAAEIDSPTRKYRIIRQPRRVVGEDTLTLTGNVAIDVGMCKNLPARTVSVTPTTKDTYYEILFAPNGGVVGRGTVSSDKIILWVRDSTKPNATDNDPVLISVQVRTGFIGSYEVDQTGGDPYSTDRSHCWGRKTDDPPPSSSRKTPAQRRPRSPSS
jgi:hypothetical protein